jgi:hypothetical protein
MFDDIIARFVRPKVFGNFANDEERRRAEDRANELKWKRMKDEVRKRK